MDKTTSYISLEEYEDESHYNLPVGGGGCAGITENALPVSPTPTVTRTPTPVVHYESASATPPLPISATPSSTAAVTPTKTETPVISISPSASSTALTTTNPQLPTPSPTQTGTPAKTPSRSTTKSLSPTSTISRSVSSTLTLSPTPTLSLSRSKTPTPTPTTTHSLSPTISKSHTPPITVTPTQTPRTTTSHTRTPIPSNSTSVTPTRSVNCREVTCIPLTKCVTYTHLVDWVRGVSTDCRVVKINNDDILTLVDGKSIGYWTSDILSTEALIKWTNIHWLHNSQGEIKVKYKTSNDGVIWSAYQFIGDLIPINEMSYYCRVEVVLTRTNDAPMLYELIICGESNRPFLDPTPTPTRSRCLESPTPSTTKTLSASPASSQSSTKLALTPQPELPKCDQRFGVDILLGGTPPACKNNNIKVSLDSNLLGKEILAKAHFIVTNPSVDCSASLSYKGTSIGFSMLDHAMTSITSNPFIYDGQCLEVNYSCLAWSPSPGQCMNGTVRITVENAH